MNIGSAAAIGRPPSFPRQWRSDRYRRRPIHLNLGTVDAESADDRCEWRIGLDRTDDPVRDAVWSGTGRERQIDVDRFRCGGGYTRALRLSEKSLRRRREHVTFDPAELFSGEIEHGDARQCDRRCKVIDDEGLVFDVVLSVA